MNEFRFPETRSGLTRKFACGPNVYLTVNAMPNGQPGEVFVKIGKRGSTLSGLMHAWAMTISAALQRGVPWPELRDKYIGSTFAPSTHEYKSLVDAVARNVDEMVEELRRFCEDNSGQRRIDFEDGEI